MQAQAKVARRSGSWWSDALHNKVIALVLAMIVAVPLFASPVYSDLTGIVALTCETFGLVLLTMLLWRSKWDLRRENLETFVRTGANLPILLFLSLVTISCVFSTAQIFSVQELLKVGTGVLVYFVVAYQFRQSKHLSLLADVLLALSLLVAVGSLAQYQLLTQDRTSILFGNVQPLGSFVMLLLPVVAALAIADKNPKRQMTALITSVLMVGCLLLTRGRSAWLGGLAGLVTLALLWAKYGRVAQVKAPLSARKHQFVLPAVVAVATLGFLGAMSFQNSDVVQRAGTVTALGTDMSFQARVQDSWHGAVTMIQQRPLTGWGAGLFPVYQRQFTGVGRFITPTGGQEVVSLSEQAHNFYLQTAAELGIPGLLVFVAVLGSFLVMGVRRLSQMEPGIRRTLLMGSLAATVGFAFDAFSSPSWQYVHTAMFFWVVLGMGTSCLRPRQRVMATESAAIHLPSRRATLFTRPVAVAACLLFATLLPTAYGAAQSSNIYCQDSDPSNDPPGGCGSNGGNGGGGSNGVAKVAVGAGIAYGLYALLLLPLLRRDDEEEQPEEPGTGILVTP